jgi:hypothetical protein
LSGSLRAIEDLKEAGWLQVPISLSQRNEIMQKVRVPQQADLDGTVPKSASSPYDITQGDPVYFGYWSKEEVLKSLKECLESERICVKAFAAIGRAADLFESELAQGELKKEMPENVFMHGAVTDNSELLVA